MLLTVSSFGESLRRVLPRRRHFLLPLLPPAIVLTALPAFSSQGPRSSLPYVPSSSAGSTTKNEEPRPGADSTQMLPLYPSTMDLTIASPRPVPRTFSDTLLPR